MSKKVLVICGDQYHSGDHVMAGLRASKDEKFELIQAPDGPISGSPDSYSAVVLAKLNVSSPRDSTPWTSEDSDQALCKFVNNGGGLLVVHAGTVGYSKVPGIHKLTGGTFIHHPAACEVTIEPVAGHQMTKDTIGFTVFDEHYFVEQADEREDFLLTRSEHGVQPGGWTKSFGAGRVCVFTPGHFESVWRHPQFQSLVGNGLRWITHG
jgi:uncharacterized protein